MARTALALATPAATRHVRYSDLATWRPGEREHVIVNNCPLCFGTHEHFVPPGRPARDVWRVPPCEALAESPRAYMLELVATRPAPDRPKKGRTSDDRF